MPPLRCPRETLFFLGLLATTGCSEIVQPYPENDAGDTGPSEETNDTFGNPNTGGDADVGDGIDEDSDAGDTSDGSDGSETGDVTDTSDGADTGDASDTGDDSGDMDTGDDSSTDDDSGTGDDTGPCDGKDCGAGVCSESSGECECDQGATFDPVSGKCVDDPCGDVQCDSGETCDPGTGECTDICTPDRSVGDFSFCTLTGDSNYLVVARYDGSSSLDLDATEVRLNGHAIDGKAAFDATSQTFVFAASNLPPGKYSHLIRARTSDGTDLLSLFMPMWIGRGVRYSDFTWNDAIVYQVFTDRFLNGDTSNDIDNSQGSLAEVDDFRSQWQGGDFAGITAKIKDGYFEQMGITALWISSPIVNSHNSQPSVHMADTRRFGSYHSYHPIATGHTHLDDYGYPNPIEPAFGTPEELHELVNEAHARGIRVVPDFVANHVQIEANIYSLHPEWFFPHNWCDGNWETARIGCWFTPDTPDFDYGSHPQAIAAVVDHAVWMVQEFNFDGFRVDALKHMDDNFTRALKTAIREQVETRVNDHSMATEPTVFYMVGESLNGWARYHVREDMVQGQVDEGYYWNTNRALITFESSVRELAEFSIGNDSAYLTEQETMGGAGGYPGAIMGNFFGNHDQRRALTEAGAPDNPDAYRRLRLAQTHLMTSPYNVPMLYQGDDIGTEGAEDPDNRKMQRFDGLTAEEQASLDHVRRAGKLREEHPALRRGTREHVVVEDWYWVYKVTYGSDEVYVAINRDADKSWSPPDGYTDGLGNCSNGVVPTLSSCVFVAN